MSSGITDTSSRPGPRLSQHAETIDAFEEGRRLLAAARYREALEVLAAATPAAFGGQREALLGVAHFQLQHYPEAAGHLAAALEYEPGNDDWRELHEKAGSNVLAEVHESVPALAYFDRRTLLAPAGEPDFHLPAPRTGLEPLRLRRLLIGIGSPQMRSRWASSSPAIVRTPELTAKP